MDVIIVAGFLGAGKTTLVRHMLQSGGGPRYGKIALIINEVGRIGIDGKLLSGRNVDMVELTSGCICCSMKNDFLRAVAEIHERVAPDALVVEATGVAQPADVMDAFLYPPLKEQGRLRSLITVVNADMFKAREVLGPFYDNQIRCADVVLLNKIDLVSPEELDEIRAAITELNPTAAILPTRYCKVDLSLLMEDGPRERRRPLHLPLHDDGFQTFSFEDGPYFEKGRLEGFLSALPPTVYRLKGWVRFQGGSGHLDFSGGRYRIDPLEDHRATSLTFIGRNCAEEKILADLKACLAGGEDE
jgi:G3E family GTPase